MRAYQVSATLNYLILETSHHVLSNLAFYKYDGSGGWGSQPCQPCSAGARDGAQAGARDGAQAGASQLRVPCGESVSLRAIWPDSSDELWITRSGNQVSK